MGRKAEQVTVLGRKGRKGRYPRVGIPMTSTFDAVDFLASLFDSAAVPNGAADVPDNSPAVDDLGGELADESKVAIKQTDAETVWQAVLDRLEGCIERIYIGPDLGGRRIFHRYRHLNIGEAPCENPKVASEGASVQHLDHQFYIFLVEEPEVARVTGQLDGNTNTVLTSCGTPCDRDSKATFIQE